MIGEMRTGMDKWHDGDRWGTTGITDQVANSEYNWVYPEH